MGLLVITPPTVEPLDIEEVKQQLRVVDTDQDFLLRSLVVAAREKIENAVSRTIPLTTYRLTLDYFPRFQEPIKLPAPPLVSVNSITYIDNLSGDTLTLDPSQYIVDTTSEPGRITPAFNCYWPQTQVRINAVNIEFTAGYAAPPDAAKHVMRLLIDHWYQNREAVTEKTMMEMPMGVESLLDTLDWGSYV